MKGWGELQDEEIILGIDQDGQHLTLYKSRMISYTTAPYSHNDEQGEPLVRYSVTYILLGTHCNSLDELQFNQISAEIFNLDEWINKSGFVNFPITPNKQKTVNLKYKLPKPIKFNLMDGVIGCFNFSSGLSGLSRHLKLLSIKQKVEYRITYSKEKNLEELMNDIFIFQNFLTLALYKNTSILSVILEGKRHTVTHDDKKYTKKITLLYPQRNANVNGRVIYNPKCFLISQELKETFMR
jgi:hypothetical protein